MKFDLYQYLLLFTAIAASSSILTPFFRAIARKANIFDHPGGRKLQESPIAYLGGLAVATPITLGSLIIVFIPSLSEIKFQVYLGLIIPSIIIALIGLFDDIYQLPPLPRFIAQSGVGFITSVMLYLTDSGVKLFDKSWLNYLVTTLWVVTIINALNFMDNMDGLATCLSIMISMSMFALSYLNEQYVVSALCVAIFAACIGFLFWNKKPATIYLGDAGALYLGFLLAAISIRIDIQSQSEIIRVLVPLLIFAIPVIDIVQVVIRRIVKGSSPFDGGRDHLSHLLLTKGLSEGKVLTVLITSAAVLSFFGIFLSEVI
jgi:UDP-GlcNAc:undecaprenyl-phosphate GlcNAc-1-phosphate transferase